MWELLGWLHPAAASLGMIHGQGSLDPAGLHVLVIPWLFDSLWRVVLVLLKPDEPDCPNPLPCSVFDQHIPRPSFTWSDEPEHSLGSPLVGQVGFAILKFPHLAGVEDLFVVK